MQDPQNETPPEQTLTETTAPEEDTPEVEGSGHPKAKRHPVIEIFGPTIQGEGSQAGQQTMFVRFGGCDYRCGKCDSLHAVEPQAIQKHATRMTAQEIAGKLWNAREETGVKWVTFSGGNPCMHKLDELVSILIQEGWFINVETQGTLWQDWVNEAHCLTISPKSPGMGEKLDVVVLKKFLEKTIQGRPLCVKVVVFSPQDIEFALLIKDVVESVRTDQYAIAYYFSLGNPYPPVLNDDFDLVDNPAVTLGKIMGPEGSKPLVDTLLHDYRTMSDEILPDPRLKDWRFLPQLHVLVYGNESER